MDILIRTANITDAHAIQALSMQLGYLPSVEDTSQYINTLGLSDSDLICVATLDNVVVGWIHVFYAIRLESDAFCEIGGLVVDAAHRARGIGGKLIARAIAWTKEKNCTKLRVRTNIIRTETHKFYASAGFAEVKQQKIFEIDVASIK